MSTSDLPPTDLSTSTGSIDAQPATKRWPVCGAVRLLTVWAALAWLLAIAANVALEIAGLTSSIGTDEGWVFSLEIIAVGLVLVMGVALAIESWWANRRRPGVSVIPLVFAAAVVVIPSVALLLLGEIEFEVYKNIQ